MAKEYATTKEYLIDYRTLNRYLIKQIRSSGAYQNITDHEGVDEFVISFQTRPSVYNYAGENIVVRIHKLTNNRSNVHFHSKLKSTIQQFDWNNNKKNVELLSNLIEKYFDVEAQQGQASVEQGQTRIVTCRSCGAINTIITGQRNDCEYCGSPIE